MKLLQNLNESDMLMAKFAMAMFVLQIMGIPFLVFMHEWGHMCVGAIFGIQTERLVIGWVGGKTFLDASACIPIIRMIIYASGGLVEMLVIILIAKLIDVKYLYIVAVAYLPYTVWESMLGYYQSNVLHSVIYMNIVYMSMAIIFVVSGLWVLKDLKSIKRGVDV